MNQKLFFQVVCVTSAFCFFCIDGRSESDETKAQNVLKEAILTRPLFEYSQQKLEALSKERRSEMVCELSQSGYYYSLAAGHYDDALSYLRFNVRRQASEKTIDLFFQKAFAAGASVDRILVLSRDHIRVKIGPDDIEGRSIMVMIFWREDNLTGSRTPTLFNDVWVIDQDSKWTVIPGQMLEWNARMSEEHFTTPEEAGLKKKSDSK